MFIEIDKIFKKYNNDFALNNVSFNIDENSVLGLVGHNGAGKTTLLRIISGITSQDSGTVYINGNPITYNDRLSIGYLTVERGLYQDMKMYDMLMYFARLKGLSRFDARQEIDKWLLKFQIDNKKDYIIRNLSKGMQQKIQFISTVIHKPSLLILDEPFSGFDPINVEFVKHEILEIDRKSTRLNSMHIQNSRMTSSS